MRFHIAGLFCFLFFQPGLHGQSIPYQSAAQRVTNRYAALVALSNNDNIAVTKAIQSLEEKGIYSKLISFNIGKYFTNNECYNVIIPLDYEASFKLTVEAGAPIANAGGIQMNNGDTLNTHFINDLATKAPNIGIFWYTDVGVNKPIISSESPFNVEPDFNGKAYVSIWASASGVPVPPTPPGFCLAQRVDSATVEFYQGGTRYGERLPINSPNPTGKDVLIQGNSDGSFILKFFGITEALTEQEVVDLKQIIEELITDLGQ